MSSPVIESGFFAGILVYRTVQGGLGSLLRRLVPRVEEYPAQKHDAREERGAHSPAELGTHDARMQAVHVHSGSCKFAAVHKHAMGSS